MARVNSRVNCIQQSFIDNLLGIRCCVRPWGHRGEWPAAPACTELGVLVLGGAQECKQTQFNSVTAVVAEDKPRSEGHRGGIGMLP